VRAGRPHMGMTPSCRASHREYCARSRRRIADGARVWLDCEKWPKRTVGVVSGPSGGNDSMSTIESVSHEHRIFQPPTHFVAQANVKKADFDALHEAAAYTLHGV